MTRNVAQVHRPAAPARDGLRTDLPDEAFRLTLRGPDPRTVRASAYDPLSGRSVPARVTVG